MARPLVIGREAGRVRRLGDLAIEHLLEGVEALAAVVEVVHEMHFGGLADSVFVVKGKVGLEERRLGGVVCLEVEFGVVDFGCLWSMRGRNFLKIVTGVGRPWRWLRRFSRKRLDTVL